MTISRTVPWTGPLVVAALGLAACGGGGGASTPEPAAAFVLASDRIEPFDPALGPSAKALAAAPPAPLPVPAAASVRLTPLAASALPLPKQGAASLGKGARQQIGVPRAVDATATAAALRAQLQWHATGHGTQRAALRFEAQGAHGVRLGLRVRALPPSTVLRFYGQDGAQVFEVPGDEVLRTLARNQQAGAQGEAARTYWSPDLGGAATTLELELPADADLQRLDLAVPRLSHFFVSPDQGDASSLAKVGEAGSCNVDVTCRPEYSAESRSVARMLFVEDDGLSYVCTGTLLNDARSSATPYFLTAHHCMATQSAASSLSTEWFYRASACNSGQPYAGAVRLHGGARLLYSEAATDTAFLRLQAPPPAGAVFAGSYFGAVHEGEGVASIHHPGGDLQKLNEGTVRRFENCTLNACTASTAQAGRFLTVGWSSGTSEGGSSGAGLFLPIGSRRYIAGQLLGGTASCQNPGGDDRYGRFDLAFYSALKTWLVPEAASPTSP